MYSFIKEIDSEELKRYLKDMTVILRDKQCFLNTLTTVSGMIQSCSNLSIETVRCIQNVKGIHIDLYTILRQMYFFYVFINYRYAIGTKNVSSSSLLSIFNSQTFLLEYFKLADFSIYRKFVSRWYSLLWDYAAKQSSVRYKYVDYHIIG